MFHSLSICKIICRFCLDTFVSFIPFFVFGHFWRQCNKNMKILRNICLHFARQDGQDGKNRKWNHTTKVTKIPKTKRQKYGMNETFVWILFFYCTENWMKIGKMTHLRNWDPFKEQPTPFWSSFYTSKKSRNKGWCPYKEYQSFSKSSLWTS